MPHCLNVHENVHHHAHYLASPNLTVHWSTLPVKVKLNCPFILVNELQCGHTCYVHAIKVLALLTLCCYLHSTFRERLLKQPKFKQKFLPANQVIYDISNILSSHKWNAKLSFETQTFLLSGAFQYGSSTVYTGKMPKGNSTSYSKSSTSYSKSGV